MGYNNEYFGQFPFESSWIGESGVRYLCGQDLRTVEGFTLTEHCSYFNLKLKSDGILEWDVSEKSLITPELLNNTADYIRKWDPSFKWIDTEVKCIGEEHGVWYLICENGVWHYSEEPLKTAEKKLQEALERIKELEAALNKMTTQ